MQWHYPPPPGGEGTSSDSGKHKKKVLGTSSGFLIACLARIFFFCLNSKVTSNIKGTLSYLVNFPKHQISPTPSKFYKKKKKKSSTFRVSSSGSFSPLSSFSSLLIFSTSACCLNNSASCLRDAIFTKCSSFIRLNSGSTS